MIAELTGIVREKGEHYCILDVQGVGYLVFTTHQVLSTLAEDTSATLSTYLAVKENALDLYGFLTRSDKKLFELLLGVSGIGPKTALSVMNTAHAEHIERAVLEQNPGYLSKMTGVSKKIAEKIALELKGKLIPHEGVRHERRDHETDALEALVSLGYREREVREALSSLTREDPSLTDTKTIIARVLKSLSH